MCALRTVSTSVLPSVLPSVFPSAIAPLHHQGTKARNYERKNGSNCVFTQKPDVVKTGVSCHDRKSPAKVSQASAVYNVTTNAKGPRNKDQGPDLIGEKVQFTASHQIPEDQGPDWSGDKVRFTDSLQIPENQGPRPRLKWREGAVYRLTINTRGPRTKAPTEVEKTGSLQTHFKYQRTKDQGARTKAKTEVERRCSLQHHFKYQRTKDQGPDWSGEKVQFTASLQIPED
jgi:hypothetical protein